MSDLIEGMARAIAAVNSTPAKRGDWQDFVLDAQAAFAFLADPKNITPKMVEAVNNTFTDVLHGVDHGDFHGCIKTALTAALTAAKEG